VIQILAPLKALFLIGSYGSIMSALIISITKGFGSGKLEFLVAQRKISRIPGAFSIAESWLLAPALFLSAEKSYTQGWVGLFWFLAPNVACLIFFAYFADRMRRMYPDGYTCAGFMRERYSLRVQRTYVFAHGGLATCTFAVELLAGGTVISAISGLPYYWTTIALAAVPVGYSLWTGMRGSIVSDFIQLSIVLGIGALVIPWTIIEGGGFNVVLKGIYGLSGTYSSLIAGDGWNVFLAFGLPATIGLMSGPFGDQSFWQRAFAIKRDDVKSAFLIAPWIFALVPIGMALLGFLAAGMSLPTDNPSRINVQVVATLLPQWAAVLFACLLLAGLTSKLDTSLSSISALAGHDVAGETTDASSLWFSRSAMVILVVGGIAIANVPGLKLEYLFLTYGTMRAAALLPTIITLLRRNVSEPAMFWGIWTSLAVGLPMFGYGIINKILLLSIGGSLFTMLASGAIVLVGSALRRSADSRFTGPAVRLRT
jgi:Na+/proline symporter